MIDDLQRLALETIQKDKQALVFLPSRASAEKTAEDIAKSSNSFHPELEQATLKALTSPTKQCRRLSQCLKKGIAFHHAGLVQKQKSLIEDEFKKGTVKIICATPTLACGLSLPAFRVIIKSLKRYSGQWGMDWIPVLEYLQMAGRAGRPEYEQFGEAIVVAKTEAEKKEIFNRYLCGKPEDIYSKLAVEPVLRTYLLSLISSGIIRDEKSMQDFFSKTFWAQQFKDMQKLEGIMDQMVSLLAEWNFIKISEGKEEDFVPASQMNQTTERKMFPTTLGKRVSELYLDPLTAQHLLECLQKYQKSTFSLLQMISHTLEMRPLLRIKKKEEEQVQEELIKHSHLLLKDEPNIFDLDYPEFMNSIKTTLFFKAWINEKEEDYLLETFGIRPGEIRAKLESANWLLYASGELDKILDYHSAVKDLRKLRIRVKHGAREELLPLLKLKGIGRVRARKLVSNSIKGLADLKRIDLTSLTQILGQKIAADVKKQLGEEVKEIKKGTRKGQLSIEKF